MRRRVGGGGIFVLSVLCCFVLFCLGDGGGGKVRVGKGQGRSMGLGGKKEKAWSGELGELGR